MGAPMGPDEAEPEVTPVRRPRSLQPEAESSLKPELLSGRSLQPPPKKDGRSFLRRRWRIIAAVVLVVLLAGAFVGAKIVAEDSADEAMAARSEELAALLDGATPEDFLAFSAGVQTEGSLAQQVRDTDGFVNLKAGADLTFIRFQPEGWWAGFTERCLVVQVTPDAVAIDVPKRSCVRVSEPQR